MVSYPSEEKTEDFRRSFFPSSLRISIGGIGREVDRTEANRDGPEELGAAREAPQAMGRIAEGEARRREPCGLKYVGSEPAMQWIGD